MKAAGEDNLVFDLLELNLVLVVFDQETILVLVVFGIVRLLQAFVAEEEVVLNQSQAHY